MGFHYEDGTSRRRQCWPLSAKAPYGLRLEIKRAPNQDTTL